MTEYEGSTVGFRITQDVEHLWTDFLGLEEMAKVLMSFAQSHFFHEEAQGCPGESASLSPAICKGPLLKKPRQTMKKEI